MKNVIKIFKRDMKNIFTNWAATIVLLALIVIPSLYSLINISASWDPYSNTNGLKVAVINDDKGTVFEEKDINLGNDLVEKLKDNDKLQWVFVDKETAKEGLLLEKYYATIEIPENFSEDVTTITKKHTVKPKLIYTVNEKKNGIAAKITDSGVKSVKSQLDQNVVKSISGILFRLCDEVGLDIEENRSEIRNIMDSIYKLDENMPELEVLLDEAINGTISISDLLEKGNEIIPVASDTLDATNEFLNKTQNYLNETQGDLDYDTPKIKEELIKSENLLDTSSVALKNLDGKILPEVAKKALLTLSDSANATKESVDDAKLKLKAIKKTMDKFSDIEIPTPSIDQSLQGSSPQIAKVQQSLDKQRKALKNAQGALEEESKTISKLIGRLNTINEQLDILTNRSDKEIKKLDNGEKLDTQNLTDTIKVLDDAHTLVSDILDKYDSEIIPTINRGFDSSREISDMGSNLAAQGKNILPDVEALINTFQNVSGLSNEELNKLKEKFPEIKDNVHELAGRLKKIDNKGDIDELLDMITNNWEEQSDFFASPVEIQDNRLFSWPNYGSAVTPFYTVLCLWIGGYMLSIILGTHAHSLEEGKKLTHNEMYFGRMLLFLFIGVGQAIVASTGALFVLHVYAVHPIMFVLYSIFVSIVFMIIIYTAVSIWGHTGIIIGVILLVIQVAGASGNFPIEVNPSIFQKIFPMLPFTYAISGMRQIMAGIVYSILIKDSVILFGFMIISIVMGVLLKEATNRKRRKFVQKLKDSSIMSS
jgi:YhgE/Pip-like protein